MEPTNFVWGQILAAALCSQNAAEIAQQHLGTYKEFLLEQEESELTQEEQSALLEQLAKQIEEVQTSFECFTVTRFMS